MNTATIIVGLLVLAVFVAIVGCKIYNIRRNKGGCSCGCAGCANSRNCHPS